MSTRLQVVLDEREHKRIQKIARQQGLTVSEWVRRTLRHEAGRQAVGDPRRKLAALQRAVEHAFPTGEVGQMLEEIEQGYHDGLEP